MIEVREFINGVLTSHYYTRNFCGRFEGFTQTTKIDDNKGIFEKHSENGHHLIIIEPV